MCRRKQFSDKITLFLATHTHVAEFLLWLLAVTKRKKKVDADYWQVKLSHILFPVRDKAKVTILFKE